MILGGGVTGLAAGMASGLPVYEAADRPGGLCRSYTLEGYRFEVGGGHWIFGGTPEVLARLERLTPTRTYTRAAAVYFADRDLTVPYPLQAHLDALGPEAAAAARREMAAAPRPVRTMAEWLRATFGPTLCARFFDPFHARYTAGLWETIAPQDPAKSPRQGTGYNGTFRYPVAGLAALVDALAARCDLRTGHRVTAIDVEARVVHVEGQPPVPYTTLYATLPLDRLLALTGLDAGRPDPATAVLVLNVGAVPGPRLPHAHWVYVPDSQAGCHRVGIYSNVDPAFAPPGRVGLYVERAYPRGARPTPEAEAAVVRATVTELRDWGWIGDVDVVDPTWIDTAYTWAWPDATWRATAIARLAGRGIRPLGRYGRWVFQGIAESIGEGLAVGAPCSTS